MTALFFDRSTLTRTLQHEARLSRDRAEAIADAVIGMPRMDLATEADVARSVTVVTAAMKEHVAATRFDLIRTLAGFLALQTAIVPGAILDAASILKP